MAKWKYDYDKDITLCSNCGKSAPLSNEIDAPDGEWESPFCPWCGANMEKDDTNEPCIMTKDEAIKEIEEYIKDADKAISEDEEYIRGWKTALLVSLEVITKIRT